MIGESALRVGDRITIEVKGTVSEVHPLSFMLDLSTQGQTNFPYRDVKLIHKERTWKVGEELTTVEDLEELPFKSVIIMPDGYVYQKVTAANSLGFGEWKGTHGTKETYGADDFFYYSNGLTPACGRNPKLLVIGE